MEKNGKISIITNDLPCYNENKDCKGKHELIKRGKFTEMRCIIEEE